ncbi:MAG: ATP-binding protein [Pseudomonadales bacterium]
MLAGRLQPGRVTPYLLACAVFVLASQVEVGALHAILVLLPIWIAYQAGYGGELIRIGVLSTVLTLMLPVVDLLAGRSVQLEMSLLVSLVLIWSAVVLGRHATAIADHLAEQLQSSQRLNAALRAEQLEDARKRRILMSAMEDVRLEIERRKALEAELTTMLSRLEAANDELESFSYIASHDLQEPLRTLSSYVRLLADDLAADAEDDVAQDLAFIRQAADRMSHLVSDLLAYSRAGRRALQIECFDINECVDDALKNLSVQIAERQASIQRDQLPTIEGDKTMVTQLLQNLMSNAIKFTPADDKPRLRVTAALQDKAWVFGVKDNGIGVQEEYCAQIFAPFKRLHGVAEYEGSGIGLAICKKIVEHHDGQLWVRSEPGRGSHFQFTLGESARAAA